MLTYQYESAIFIRTVWINQYDYFIQNEPTYVNENELYQLYSRYFIDSMDQPERERDVTRPSDALVVVGSRVVFNCSTDLIDSPMNWFHTHVGPVEFYFLEGILQMNELYKFGRFTVDKPVMGQYNLIIENVTARHAGRYDCKDAEAYRSGKIASAELTVFESVPTCAYVVTVDSTEAEIICNLSLSGNAKLKLVCQDGCYRTSNSTFGVYDNSSTTPSQFMSTYLSTKAHLLLATTEETDFICYILRDYTFPPLIGMHVRVEHKTVRNKTSTNTTPAGTTTTIQIARFIETNTTLLIPFIACTSSLLIIVIILGSILYKYHREKTVNRHRKSTQRGKRIYLSHQLSQV
jgi:hypothetical protein